jgi:predicted nucleic acid-binding protein
MRALLDINVVIALLDPDHAFHEQAHAWWAAQAKLGWASCPIVENGIVHIMSNPGYLNVRGENIGVVNISGSVI